MALWSMSTRYVVVGVFSESELLLQKGFFNCFTSQALDEQ